MPKKKGSRKTTFLKHFLLKIANNVNTQEPINIIFVISDHLKEQPLHD